MKSKFSISLPSVQLLSGLLFLGMTGLHAAIIPTPTWLGDADTTFQSWTFATSSTTADPDSYTNPFGTPAMQVNVVPDIAVGTGYQDPAVPTEIHRVDGAWDLGPDGDIAFTIPVDTPGSIGPGFVVDVFVSVVYEGSIFDLPGISNLPSSISSTTVNPAFESQDIFNWGLVTSETTIGEVPTDLIQVLVEATGDFGSLVDTVEIHTRTRYQVIPEPGKMALYMAAFTFVFLVARRYRLRAVRASPENPPAGD